VAVGALAQHVARLMPELKAAFHNCSLALCFNGLQSRERDHFAAFTEVVISYRLP
jgi:hypothetical protein